MNNLDDLKSLIELIVGIFAIIGVIYRIAQVENSIYSKIEKNMDYSRENIIKIQSHDEIINYKLEELTERLNTIESVLAQVYGKINK